MLRPIGAFAYLLLSLCAQASYMNKSPTRITLCGNSLRVEGSGVKTLPPPTRTPIAPVQGLKTEKTSLDADYLNIGKNIPETYRPKNFSDTELDRGLMDLGWGNPMFMNGRADIASFIVENRIAAPSSDYAYHGTSTTNYQSILESGLNNLRGQEAHAGGVMGRSPVTYTGDAQLAQDFAETSTSQLRGKPMLLRFPLSKLFRRPILKSETGALSNPMTARSLEYSLDGGATWLNFESNPL